MKIGRKKKERILFAGESATVVVAVIFIIFIIIIAICATPDGRKLATQAIPFELENSYAFYA